ncbi:MAG: ABC transporter ATP-binding protein [Candidatus Omnitrophota bacterium]
MSEILSIKHLSYIYINGNKHIKALKGIDFTVNEGSIFGFIGPNGAGKTTVIKLVLGMMILQCGDITIYNKPVSDARARQRVGYMPEKADYYKYLTPEEILWMYGSFFAIERNTLKKRINNLLGLVDLENEKKRLMGTFSKGMMQRVSFAQALINEPDLLILDEPMGGLDPLARRRMKEIIFDLKNRGKTIFFSSHELSEVELICDHIAVLNRGLLAVHGEVKDLLGKRQEGQSLENYFINIIGDG